MSDSNGSITKRRSADGVIEIRDPEINVQEIMEQIRATIRERSSGAGGRSVSSAPSAPSATSGIRALPSPAARIAAPSADAGALDAHWHALRANLQQANRLHDSPRKAILPRGTRMGPIGSIWAQVVLKVVNRLRAFVVESFEYQVSFNSYTVRTLNEMVQVLSQQRDREQEERAKLQAALDRASDRARQRETTQEHRLQELLNDLEAMRERQVAQELQLQEALERLEAVQATASEPSLLEWPTFEHQEAFRSGASDVKAHLSYYVRFFQPGQHVLDAGCGRGEFLLCLREAGVGAYGLDLDEDVIAYAKRHLLDVRQEDVISHLQGLPEKSLDGIFAGQLIEHLTVEQQLTFYREAYRTLKVGSYLVCETPNPLSLVTAATNFWIDPTHHAPIHPQALSFLLRSVGFSQVELYFSSPQPAEALLTEVPTEVELDPSLNPVIATINRNTAQLNALLYGEQDYAAIARR